MEMGLVAVLPNRSAERDGDACQAGRIGRKTRTFPALRSGVPPMSSAFDRIADIIAETGGVPRETITPESHVIDDLGIDSLDFLDIVFAIDKDFGIKVPVEAWTQEVNEGKAPAGQYFVMGNLATRIEELVAAKKVGA